MTIQRFDLIMSSTGTLAVPSKIIEEINAAAASGATQVMLVFDAGVGTLETRYRDDVERQIETGRQVGRDFVDTLAELAK